MNLEDSTLELEVDSKIFSLKNRLTWLVNCGVSRNRDCTRNYSEFSKDEIDG